jgi:RecG-like helicase
MHVPRTAATIIPYRLARTKVPEGRGQERPVSDEVARGGMRQESNLAADVKLAQRATNADPIGSLVERQRTQVAGRVRALTIDHESGGHEFRCVLADHTGSITLVFQGRTEVPGIERGTRLLVSGTVVSMRREAVILNPQYEIVASPAAEE